MSIIDYIDTPFSNPLLLPRFYHNYQVERHHERERETQCRQAGPGTLGNFTWKFRSNVDARTFLSNNGRYFFSTFFEKSEKEGFVLEKATRNHFETWKLGKDLIFELFELVLGAQTTTPSFPMPLVTLAQALLFLCFCLGLIVVTEKKQLYQVDSALL